MSNVWETRYRLLLEQFDELADQMRSKEQVAPRVLEEQTVRLLTSMVMLLGRHNVNKRGQCRVCAPSRRWKFWRRRPRCTVYRTVDFVMRQPLDVVWQQLPADHKTQPNLF